MNHKSDFLGRLRAGIENSSLIKRGDRVLVSLSGGADSVALFCALSELRHEFGYEMSAYHLNHSLRGADADRDEDFCRRLCERLSVIFYSEKIDVGARAEAQGISFEDAGRRTRYEGLAAIVAGMQSAADIQGAEGQDTGRVLVATGHHAGDVAETFFMNALRGAGLSGLCSISDRAVRSVSLNVRHSRNEYGGFCGAEMQRNVSSGRGVCRLEIIRPLVGFQKSELIEYLISTGQDWREDATNESDDYFRNRIRKLLNEMYIKKIGECIGLLQKDRDFLDAHAERLADALISEGDYFGVKRVLLKLEGSLDFAEISRLVRIAIKRLKGDIVDLSRRDVESVIGLSRVGAKVSLAGGVAVYRNYGELEFYFGECAETSAAAQTAFAEIFQKTPLIEDYRENPRNGVSLEHVSFEEYERLMENRVRGASCPTGRETSIVIDLEKVVGTLKVRRRQEGDSIVPLGMSGSRSLKKLLIDEKIDRRLRDDIPIVSDDEKIVWVAGVRMSELVKVDSGAAVHRSVLARLTLEEFGG